MWYSAFAVLVTTASGLLVSFLTGMMAVCLSVGLDQPSYSTFVPVTSWMGDRLRAGKPCRYVTVSGCRVKETEMSGVVWAMAQELLHNFHF